MRVFVRFLEEIEAGQDRNNSFLKVLDTQYTVFRKAYILSGFHEFLYSVKKVLKKIVKLLEFIPNPLRFHEKTKSAKV